MSRSSHRKTPAEEAAIAEMIRQRTRILHVGHRRYRLFLVIDHQSFGVNGDVSLSLREARWHQRMLAIALVRLLGVVGDSAMQRELLLRMANRLEARLPAPTKAKRLSRDQAAVNRGIARDRALLELARKVLG